jgi:hypothetical protein
MNIFKRKKRKRTKGPSPLMLTVERIDTMVQEIQAQLQSAARSAPSRPVPPPQTIQPQPAPTDTEPFEPMDGSDQSEKEYQVDTNDQAIMKRMGSTEEPRGL